MQSIELTIDLSKEKFNFSAIPNLHEIITIRFENYTDKIEIPLAINEYPNITELYFSGTKENPYQTPDNLEKFIHIKELLLWSYCDFTQMKPLPHLEKLVVQVQNTLTDTRKIVALFPNLKSIEIWGNNQNLPDEIGNLLLLESFKLMISGLENLPASFVNLKQLKELSLDRLPMNTFPAEIFQLENLEILEINQRLTKLPDDLVNLKKLKKLNLHSVLNNATMGVSDFPDTKSYLKPIPDVIGKLENLEDLNLGICGVFDITPILPLKKLKKLNLQYSGLKNCDGFSNFKMLEELNLETSYGLRNLDGLNGLPLKKLTLSHNEMKSIDVISSLTSLEILNINGAEDIKDYSPIYKHNNIKELEADDKILKRWKTKNEYRKLPKINQIINELKTDNPVQFEEAILHLSKHVNFNYSNENNPLAGYFDVETEEEEITEIEVLDSAIQKHLKNLSDKTLVTIFGMTFKSVGFDNYNATLLVLQEIIARKNIDTQQQIIEKFYKACKYYDSGHRYWTQTVHDQLIDTFFAQFTTEALYELLKKASTDMLNRKSGDGMDELFIPAFKNTTDIKLQEKLLNVFIKYEKEARTYYGKDYFDALVLQIKNIASTELENLILQKKEENIEQEKWLILLENLNEENLPEVIEQLANKATDNFYEKNLYKIINATKKINLPETSLQILLDLVIEKGNKNYLDSLLVAKYHKNLPEKIIDFLKTKLEKSQLEIIDVFNITKNIITELILLNVTFDELKIYEDFIVSHCNVSFDKIYTIEIQKLLSKFFEHNSYYSKEDISWILEKIKIIALKIDGEISYSDLRSYTYSLISSGKYEKMKQVFYLLYPKVTEIKNQNVLFYNIIAAIKLNDEPYFDLLYKEVQKIEKIYEVLLAYNLACAFAHFERKEELLFYIKDSFRLGKTKQQFLDDTDFEKYSADADFLVAIEDK